MKAKEEINDLHLISTNYKCSLCFDLFEFIDGIGRGSEELKGRITVA